MAEESSAERVTTAYPPRAMRVEQAAAYLSISRSAFLRLVEDGIMPQPVRIGGITTWDTLDLDSAYDDLKHGNGKPTENTVHQRLRELEDARRQRARSE